MIGDASPSTEIGAIDVKGNVSLVSVDNVAIAPASTSERACSAYDGKLWTSPRIGGPDRSCSVRVGDAPWSVNGVIGRSLRQVLVMIRCWC